MSKILSFCKEVPLIILFKQFTLSDKILFMKSSNFECCDCKIRFKEKQQEMNQGNLAVTNGKKYLFICDFCPKFFNDRPKDMRETVNSLPHTLVLMILMAKASKSIVGKGENAGNQHFSYSHCFLAIKNKFYFLSHFYLVACKWFDFVAYKCFDFEQV